MIVLCGFLASAGVGYADNLWKIRINIPEYQLYLYRGSELLRTFYVAVGKQDSPSPIGNFRIVTKVTDPTWYPPDRRPPVPPGPSNPLGKYWLGLNRQGYGIHGNNAEWSIGNAISKGCFRMHNEDIKYLFSLVPTGTPVEITYVTMVGGLDGPDRAWLKLFPDIYHLEKTADKIRQTILDLHWNGAPHWIALDELARRKRPFSSDIPRAIRIEGDLRGYDGFYWNQQVYLAGALPGVTVVSSPNSNEFSNYQSVKSLAESEPGQWRVDWHPETATAEVCRMKVFLNGTSLPGAARYTSEHRLELRRSMIEASLGISASPTPGVTAPATAPPEWVDLEALTREHWELHYAWDEASWTLRLNTVTGSN